MTTYSKQIWTFIDTHPQTTFSKGNIIDLSLDEHHFAYNVLRLHIDEEVWITDCNGTKACGKIIVLDKKRFQVQLEEIFIFQRKRPLVELYVGLPKLTALEEVISSASEMGADAIHIIRTQKCSHKGHIKLEKYQKLSQETVRISKIPYCAKLFYYDDFSSFMNLEFNGGVSEDQCVFFCDEELSRPEAVTTDLKRGDVSVCGIHLYDALQKNVTLQHKKISIFVGPEASFSQEEREDICALSRMVPVSLGPHILRVPTAVTVSLGTIFGFCSREPWYVTQSG
jgi:RsmE family RNA methyltransferase